MRQRQSFRVVALESLEDRQLLSHGLSSLAGVRHFINHHLFTLQGHHATSSGAGGSAQQSGGKHGQIRIPENTTTRQNSTAAATTTVPSVQAALNTVSQSSSSPTSGGANQGSAPQNYQNLVNRLVKPMSQAQVAAAGTATAVDPANPITIVPVAATTPAPATAATITTAPTTATALGQSVIPAGGPVAAQTTDPVVAGSALMPRMRFLDGLTLSKNDVAGLRTAVDDFAAHYTSGQNPDQDKTALTTLKTGLDDLAQSVWSETHVAGADDVTKFQQAVNDFAKSYTNGANLAKDKAAWSALHTALDNFAGALKAPGAATTTTTTPPGSPAFHDLGMMRTGFGDGIQNGPAFSTDDVAKLKTTVDAFADNYTSGVDSTKDKAAVDALRSGLGDLSAGRRNTANAPGSTAMDPGSTGQRHVMGAPDSGSGSFVMTPATVNKS